MLAAVLPLLRWEDGSCPACATQMSEDIPKRNVQLAQMLRDFYKRSILRAESRDFRLKGRFGLYNPAHALTMLLLVTHPPASFKLSGGFIPTHTSWLSKLPCLRHTVADAPSGSRCGSSRGLAASRWHLRSVAPIMQFDLDEFEADFYQQDPFQIMPPRAKTEEVRERTIWGYWWQGYDDMCDMFKLCVESWQRHNPDWDVRILDNRTVYDYISPDELPNLFESMESYQLASDAVRLALLCRYGGIWLDVNVLLRCNLDKLCWSDIQSGRKTAAVFYHSHYGTDAFQKKDFTESWFLATKPGNLFFRRWQGVFLELLRDKNNCYGLSKHPLYQGLDLYGIEVLNGAAGVANFDFKDYLAIHSMCLRLLQTDPELQEQWRNTFIKIDAAATAFKLQLWFEQEGETVGFAVLTRPIPTLDFMDNVPLVKFNSDHYQMAIHCPGDQLAGSTLMGDLLYDCIEYQDPEDSRSN